MTTADDRRERIRQDKEEKLSAEEQIWVKNKKGKQVKIVPVINIGLDYPDVETNIHLYCPKSDKYELTKNEKIPYNTAARLIDDRKAFWTHEEYEVSQKYPDAMSAFKDKKFRSVMVKMLKK